MSTLNDIVMQQKTALAELEAQQKSASKETKGYVNHCFVPSHIAAKVVTLIEKERAADLIKWEKVNAQEIKDAVPVKEQTRKPNNGHTLRWGQNLRLNEKSEMKLFNARKHCPEIPLISIAYMVEVDLDFDIENDAVDV